MTQIYEVGVGEGYEWCLPVDKGDYDRIHAAINGVQRAASWTAFRMHLIRVDEGERFMESDAPWFGSGVLILRPKAVLALHSILLANGELLPADCPDAPLFFFNATRVLDALDERASSIERFNDGRIMIIDRHVFRNEIVRKVDIFKIPQYRCSAIFVSQRFVDQWRSADLKGLDFKRVWSS